MSARTRRLTLGSLAFLTAALVGEAMGQGSFVPNGRDLFVLDLAGTALGGFPGGIQVLNGGMTVVDKDGQRMLRASSPSEFLIRFPQALPQNFTVAFDFIPKACCNPEDLALEGTPTMSRGTASAHIVWHRDLLSVVGGGTYYQAAMPEDLKQATPGMRTQVVVVFEGNTVKLYTNGRRLYTLSDRKFVRGGVLRVYLGGQDDDRHAVYLAGLRVAAGTGALGIVAATPGVPTQPPPPPPAASAAAQPPSQVTSPLPVVGPGTPNPAPVSTSQASTGGPIPTVVSNVSVTPGTFGPVVSWLPVSVPAVYSVRRWKIDDAACCNSASPPTPALVSPPWQDAPLPLAGTYVYEVTATMSGGVASGQAQFVYFKSGGVIATAAPPPPPAPIVSAPIAPAPRTGGASAIVLGPATLTSAPRPGWGVTLQWPEVVNARYYVVERGVTNQNFALFTTIVPAYQPPQAGNFSMEDVTVLPASVAFYRVKVTFLDGTSAYSPLARYDAPTQVAQVTNLAVSVMGPCDVTSPSGGCTPYSPTPTSNPWWKLTWTWVPVPGALTHDVKADHMIDPAVGFLPGVGTSVLAGYPPSWWQPYSGGGFVKKVRFCVSLVRPPSNVDPITNGTCLVTDIP